MVPSTKLPCSLYTATVAKFRGFPELLSITFPKTAPLEVCWASRWFLGRRKKAKIPKTNKRKFFERLSKSIKFI
jgi:hypothetical protein